MISGISGGASAWARPASADTAAKMAENLFSKLDSKNQGYVSQSDLETAFSQVSGSDSSSSTTSTSSNSEADALFKSLDGDGDGKLTETELSDGLKNLMSQLDSQMQYMGKSGFGESEGQGHGAGHGGHGGPGGMSGMPPPPPPSGASGTDDTDTGYTQDQLTSMASEIGSSDAKRATLMNALASNFSAADTNGDGKINRGEAMSYDRENKITAGVSGSSDTSSSSSSSSSASDAAALMKKIMQLMHAYEQGAGGASSSASSSSFSVTA